MTSTICNHRARQGMQTRIVVERQEPHSTDSLQRANPLLREARGETQDALFVHASLSKPICTEAAAG